MSKKPVVYLYFVKMGGQGVECSSCLKTEIPLISEILRDMGTVSHCWSKDNEFDGSEWIFK